MEREGSGVLPLMSVKKRKVPQGTMRVTTGSNMFINSLPSSELHLTRIAGGRPKSIEHSATLLILDDREEKTTAWHQSGPSSAPSPSLKQPGPSSTD